MEKFMTICLTVAMALFIAFELYITSDGEEEEEIMTDKERQTINDYILEVFGYEHDMSTTILARLLLLCELLVEKGILNEEEVEEKLSNENVGIMISSLEDDTEEFEEE